MGTNGAVVGVGSIILLISAVVAESPPVVDYGKPVPPPCPKNEVRCCRNPCPPDRCFSLYAAIRCIDNQTCVNGCYCKDNYLRLGQNGPCVPRNECPPLLCVGDPNARRGCGDRCGKTCADYKSNPICPKRPCKNDGCDCKEGYIYDTYQDKCVLPKDCTPNKCGRNEEYYCGPACPDNEASCSKPNPPICINKRCEFKCFCKKGYVRDDKNGNVCIPADKCPINCTKKHEVYFDCVAGQCGPKTCDDLGRSLSCPDIGRGHCPGGCICEQGYLRDVNGNCIKMENCPPKPCGRNQTWMSPCDTPCPYPRCPRDDKPPPPCIKIEPCYPGCQCKLNYLRNSRGDCILAPECPRVNCTRQYEKWDGCPSACLAEGCDDIYNQPTTCNTLIWLCSPRCVCKKGHFRNKEGKCIPASQCPNYCKDPNASWTDCRDICPGTCQNPKPICLSKVPCRPGCQCKKGYVLDKPGDGGKCVKVEKCPVTTTSAPITTTTPAPHKCKSNEHWTDCLPGQCKPKTCDELIKPAPCPRVKPPCPGGCICNDGYVWDAKGRCIKKENCPSHCKDPNASWTECRDICPGTCQNPKPICMSKVACRPGCQCKKGYVLDKPGDGGKCIKIQKCPAKQCKGSHEKHIDCPAGQCDPKTCDDLVNPPACPRIKPPCPGGCVCEDGYLRDKNGKCIPKEQCPSLQCKKKNERWSNCLLGECVPKHCEDVGYPVPCPDLIGPCAGGCTCIEGFVRNCEGECIDMKDCPCCGGDPYAVSGCGNPCGKTCASLYANNSDLMCPQYCEYNGCDCKPGYRLLIDSTGSKKCVPESECPKPTPECGANEQYYCGTSCPEASCVDPTPPTCVNKKCKFACFCKKGFVRDFNNTCIPVNKCPKCKGPHEKLISCPVGQCNPKTCKDLITPPGCPRVIPPCPDGCVCVEGYLRDAKGTCIEKSLCPGVCKDPNASWTDCRSPCPGTCYNTKPVCPSKPCSPGCQCNEGYVLSKQGKDGKCVKIETCADYIHCPRNQTFVTCTFKGCPQVRCPQSDQTILCKPPRDCPGGCGCKPFYRYDVNNNCIKSPDCPPVECTRDHEVFKCKHLGDWEYCDERYNSPPFWEGDPNDCEPKCACAQGYWRNPQTNTCVTENECPPI